MFDGSDQDVAAVQFAQLMFANSARTYGNPTAGAQATLALEYEAGALNTSPRWAALPATIQLQLLQARIDLRAAAGIAMDAPSQAVVDALCGLVIALRNGNEAAAAASVGNRVFMGAPADTLRRLANLPYLQVANVATTLASEAIATTDGRGGSGN